MSNSTPTVIVGSDMPPELFVDVSTTLKRLGVAVETDDRNGSGPALGRIIVVVSPKGGSGKTALSANLAVALAQRHPGRVAAVDLDAQFGDLPLALSIDPERNLAQLARSDDIDATTTKVHLTPSSAQLFVLAGADDPVDAESIRDEHVSTVLPILAGHFDYTVVDTAAGLDELTLAALDCATDVVLLSSLDVTSIRSLRKVSDTLNRIGIPAERRMVLNRADSKVGLEAADAAEVMGMDISCTIPSSRSVPMSLNLGEPFVTSEPKSQVARQVNELASMFSPTAVGQKKRGWRR